MSNLLFSQRGKALLTVQLNPADVKVYVDNIASFADATALFDGSKYLPVTLESYDRATWEIVHATAVGSDGGGDYFTIVRAQEDTLAQTFYVGDTTVQARATRGMMESLRDDAATGTDLTAHLAASNPHNITPAGIGAALASHTHAAYLADAPSNGNTYARKDGGWVSFSALNEFFNVVRDFACPTDGVSDCSTAVQAALAAAYSAGGGTIYFPPGDYTFLNQVTMRPKVVFRGAGHRASKLINSVPGPLPLFTNVVTAYNNIMFIDLDMDSTLGGGFFYGGGNNIRFVRVGGSSPTAAYDIYDQGGEVTAGGVVFEGSFLKNTIIRNVVQLYVRDCDFAEGSLVVCPDAEEAYVYGNVFDGDGAAAPLLNLSNISKASICAANIFTAANSAVKANAFLRVDNNLMHDMVQAGVFVTEAPAYRGPMLVTGNRMALDSETSGIFIRRDAGADAVRVLGAVLDDRLTLKDLAVAGDRFDDISYYDAGSGAITLHENEGTAVLSDSDELVAHGLAGTPASVFVQLQGTAQPLDSVTVLAVDNTNLQIASANVTYPATVYWRAKL